MTVLITFGPWKFDQNPCEALQNYFDAGIEIILILVDTNANLFTCFPHYGFEMYYFETIEDLTQSWNSTFTSIDVCEVNTNYFYFFSLDQFINFLSLKNTWRIDRCLKSCRPKNWSKD